MFSPLKLAVVLLAILFVNCQSIPPLTVVITPEGSGLFNGLQLADSKANANTNKYFLFFIILFYVVGRGDR